MRFHPMSEPSGSTATMSEKKTGFHFHSWATVRDDGYWYYQHCTRCRVRRVKQKESNLTGQPPNPLWLKGEQFPAPIGEEK